MFGVLMACALSATSNVIFISVDTLRADRLGCYGYEYATSPNIDALADRSLVFDNMMVEEPQTGPSMIAMFTSQFPRVTGTTRNAVPVSNAVPTLTESFHAAGYATGAVVSNWNLKTALSNIARGFDTYEDEFGRNWIGMGKKELDAKAVSDLAIDWFESRDDAKPFFYWAHYIDPHSPYHFRGRYNVHDALPRELDSDEALDARYDSEIAYADHHIGRLLAAVPLENTFIVLTADHGESLMEHSYLGHTREIYQTTMHVPLLIAGPGVAPGRSAAPVRGVDVGPTLLAIAGLSPLPDAAGVDVLTHNIPHDRPRVFETYDGSIPDGPDARLELADRLPSRQGVIVGNWKLIMRGNKPLLFNLADDPDERKNRASEDAKLLESLLAVLRQWDTDIPRYGAESATLSETDREALEALGYIE